MDKSESSGKDSGSVLDLEDEVQVGKREWRHTRTRPISSPDSELDGDWIFSWFSSAVQLWTRKERYVTVLVAFSRFNIPFRKISSLRHRQGVWPATSGLLHVVVVLAGTYPSGSADYS